MHRLFFYDHKVCKEELFCQEWRIISRSFFPIWVSPIFFCLDCGFMMCYGIHETTVKPDVLTNVSLFSFNNFAEVEPRAHHVTGVRTLCRLNFLEGPCFLFIPPLKISPLLLAESSLDIESHQAN